MKEYTKFEVDILNGFENKIIISEKYKMATVSKNESDLDVINMIFRLVFNPHEQYP